MPAKGIVLRFLCCRFLPINEEFGASAVRLARLCRSDSPDPPPPTFSILHTLCFTLNCGASISCEMLTPLIQEWEGRESARPGWLWENTACVPLQWSHGKKEGRTEEFLIMMNKFVFSYKLSISSSKREHIVNQKHIWPMFDQSHVELKRFSIFTSLTSNTIWSIKYGRFKGRSQYTIQCDLS